MNGKLWRPRQVEDDLVRVLHDFVFVDKGTRGGLELWAAECKCLFFPLHELPGNC